MDENRDGAISNSAEKSIATISHHAREGRISSSSHKVGSGYRIVCIILGALLLVAAGFKAHALWTDPYRPTSVFSSPRWQVTFIELEGLLGLWVLSGVSPSAAWLASLGAFSILAAVSFFLAILGQPTCGCFGKVPVNPWYTCALDVMALAALLYYRPQNQSFKVLIRRSRIGSLRWSLHRLAEAVFLLGIGCATIYAMHRSDYLAELRQESLTVEPAVLEIGNGVPGEVRTVEVHVQNHTDRLIRITGGTANCRCIVFQDLPISVPARTLRSFRVQIKFVGVVGEFQKPFVLFTDNANQPVVNARFRGYMSAGKE